MQLVFLNGWSTMMIDNTPLTDREKLALYDLLISAAVKAKELNEINDARWLFALGGKVYRQWFKVNNKTVSDLRREYPDCDFRSYTSEEFFEAIKADSTEIMVVSPVPQVITSLIVKEQEIVKKEMSGGERLRELILGCWRRKNEASNTRD